MYNYSYPGRAYLGLGALENALPTIIKQFGIKNVLVVTDANLVKFGVADAVTKVLEEININFDVWDKVIPDNPMKSYLAEIDDIRAKNYDSVIGLGGGSALDCGKVINLMISKGVNTLDGLVSTQTGKLLFDKVNPFIAISTTSGTGSEMSMAAGTKDTETLRKESIYGPSVFPAASIVDGNLHKGMPPMVTLSTALDALAHVIEPLYSVQRNNVTKGFGFMAVKNIVKYLGRAVEDGNDMEARQNLAETAGFAIRAASNGGLHIGHGISHATGGQWYIPHGVATAHIIFPMVEYLAETAMDTTKELLDIFGVTNYKETEAGKVLAETMKEFSYKLGLPMLGKYDKVNLDELDIVLEKAQGFMAPRKHLLAKPLPSNEIVAEWIKTSI